MLVYTCLMRGTDCINLTPLALLRLVRTGVIRPEENYFEAASYFGSRVGQPIEERFGGLGWGQHAFFELRG